MSSSVVVDVVVTGRVQGVSFRAYAAEQAERLALDGWVRNQPDGTVALRIEGAADAVQAMLAWCHEGSPAARVEQVESEPADPADPQAGSGFSIRS